MARCCVGTAQTLATLLAGLALGGFAGLAAGIALGSSDLLRRLTFLTIEMLRPIPSVALLPLVAADLRLRLPHGDRGHRVCHLLAVADPDPERGGANRAAPDRSGAPAAAEPLADGLRRSCFRRRHRAS